jgi:hypothetical protein
MKITILAVLSALLGTVFASVAESAVKSVVLVHGSFADGSGWKPVADILKHDGYTVQVVQEPLTGLEGDVAATRLVLDRAGRRAKTARTFHGDLPGTDHRRQFFGEDDRRGVVSETQLRGGLPAGSNDQSRSRALHGRPGEVADDRASRQSRDIPLASERSHRTDRKGCESRKVIAQADRGLSAPGTWSGARFPAPLASNLCT